MIDNVFGELEYNGVSFMGKIILGFLGKTYEVSIQINSDDENTIKDKQYEAYKYFMSNWDNIQVDIANNIIEYYNNYEKDAYGPDDEEEYNSWWPDIESIEDLKPLLHIDTIIVPEDYIMESMGGRVMYVLFDRDWGGEDFDDNGVAVSIVNETIDEVGYKDIAY